MTLEELIAVVRQAGEIVNSAKQIDRHTHEKTSAADLVTDDVNRDGLYHAFERLRLI